MCVVVCDRFVFFWCVFVMFGVVISCCVFVVNVFCFAF